MPWTVKFAALSCMCIDVPMHSTVTANSRFRCLHAHCGLILETDGMYRQEHEKLDPSVLS